jgi:hypothetical protein
MNVGIGQPGYATLGDTAIPADRPNGPGSACVLRALPFFLSVRVLPGFGVRVLQRVLAWLAGIGVVEGILLHTAVSVLAGVLLTFRG